jgi:hypothetical protein
MDCVNEMKIKFVRVDKDRWNVIALVDGETLIGEEIEYLDDVVKYCIRRFVSDEIGVECGSDHIDLEYKGYGHKIGNYRDHIKSDFLEKCETIEEAFREIREEIVRILKEAKKFKEDVDKELSREYVITIRLEEDEKNVIEIE